MINYIINNNKVISLTYMCTTESISIHFISGMYAEYYVKNQGVGNNPYTPVIFLFLKIWEKVNYLTFKDKGSTLEGRICA